LDVNKLIYSNITPFEHKFRRGNENLIQYFVDHGAELNKTDKDNSTPLFEIYKTGNEKIIKHFIDHSADVNRVNFNKQTIFNLCLAN